MNYNPNCPVCGSTAWKVIGSRAYRMIDSGKTSPYVSKRLSVLFQVWFPGAPEVTLSSVLCLHCGFISYSPRPEEDDISRKYTFLASDAATQHEISQYLASDEQRSMDLYKRLSPYIQADTTILDFGGGNGRLMSAFLQQGLRCHLIDYPGDKLPGIHYLGSKLSDIQADHKFDLIVCSHVLEHLADPYCVAHALRANLAPRGIFYVEVPLEIWKKAPLPIEPVTHINYFTVDSLRILLERAGYDILTCEEGSYTTENGEPGLAVRACVKLIERKAVDIRCELSAAATLQLIHPSPLQQLVRALRYPALTWREVRRSIYRRLGKTPLLWRLLPGRAHS